jgi:ethanolamine utilization protein EutQ (cupin superfamily)
VTGVRLNRYAPSTNDWHTPKNGTFAINTEGKLEVEVSTGAKRVIGPGDLVYIGDTQGKGHVTKLLTPVTNLFITVDPKFDVVSWAAGKA